MSFASLLIQRCDVIHLGAGTPDRYNNPTWGETGREEDVHCRIDQLDPSELTVGRDTAIATHRGYFETGQAIAWYDRLEVDGETFEVTGPPNIVHDGTGPHHTEVLLRTVSDWGAYP